MALPVSQTKLKELLCNPDVKKVKFVKNMPITIYPIPDEKSLTSLPGIIVQQMGQLDQATYGDKDAYLRSNIGGAMALQVAHDALDAYPIPPDQFASNYKVVSLEEMQEKNPKAAQALCTILGDLSSIPGVCGALKTVPTEMVLASALNFPIKDRLVIEAPWGGEQVKDAGTDAYLVHAKEPYMTNLDKNGLPVAYIPCTQGPTSWV